MTETRFLARFATIANATFNSITANTTAITAISVGGTSINATAFPGTANNANNLNGQAASFYTNATNITTGTLPDARLSSAVVNTSGAFTLGGNITLNANLTIASTGELIIANGAGIFANGSLGTASQILSSNGIGVYWANSSTTVRQTFTATANQTTFTVTGGYTPNQVDVYYNGAKLVNGTEVTVNSGSNVVLTSGAANGATIDVVGVTMTTLSFANAVARTGDTMSGALSLPSNGLTVGTTQLAVSGGNVGIGTGSPAVRLDVVGNTAISGTLTAATIVESSSRTLKENIEPISDALSKVLSLNGVVYHRKGSSIDQEAGLIAEEVASVLPNLVLTDTDGNPNSVMYSKITAYLIEAVKTLNQELVELKSKIK